MAKYIEEIMQTKGKPMSKECKCDTCLNSRVVTSENGFHAACTLSSVKATECMVGIKDNYMACGQMKGMTMNEEYITKSAAIEADCNAVELFPPEYQKIENAINRVVDDVALVMDTTELEDLRVKYQEYVAGKDKNSGDVAETYITRQIELLQQILDIFDGVSEPENEL